MPAQKRRRARGFPVTSRDARFSKGGTQGHKGIQTALRRFGGRNLMSDNDTSGAGAYRSRRGRGVNRAKILETIGAARVERLEPRTLLAAAPVGPEFRANTHTTNSQVFATT